MTSRMSSPTRHPFAAPWPCCEAGPDDTVVLSLASHGFSDQAGNYFFMARDNRLSDVNTVIQNANAGGKSRPRVVSSGPLGRHVR
jgi:hypothetical protein